MGTHASGGRNTSYAIRSGRCRVTESMILAPQFTGTIWIETRVTEDDSGETSGTSTPAGGTLLSGLMCQGCVGMQESSKKKIKDDT